MAGSAPIRALTREEILGMPVIELEREYVTVPEWGNRTVLVQQFTSADSDAVSRVIEQVNEGKLARKFVRAEMLIRGVIDEDGRRVFERADADFIAKLPLKVTNRIAGALNRLNGVDVESDLLEKNSESDPVDDSSSN